MKLSTPHLAIRAQVFEANAAGWAHTGNHCWHIALVVPRRLPHRRTVLWAALTSNTAAGHIHREVRDAFVRDFPLDWLGGDRGVELPDLLDRIVDMCRDFSVSEEVLEDLARLVRAVDVLDMSEPPQLDNAS